MFSSFPLRFASRMEVLAVLCLAVLLAGCGRQTTLAEPGPPQPQVAKTSRSNLGFDGHPPGVLVGEDGRFLPPELRVVPPVRQALQPQAEWSVPANVLAEIPGGHLLDLRSTTTGQSPKLPMVAPGIALPAWRLPLDFSQFTGADPIVEIHYLAGPRGTDKALIQWNGTVLETLDTFNSEWELRTAKITLTSTQPRDGISVLELSNADRSAFDPGHLPSGFLVTGVDLPAGVPPSPAGVEVKDSEGELFLLPRVAAGQPVRLWTLGHGTDSNPEFTRDSGEFPEIANAGPQKTLQDGSDAELVHVRYQVERKANGAQVADFRRAVAKISTFEKAGRGQALSMEIIFKSPVSGTATLRGSGLNGWGRAAGRWHVEIGGNRIDAPCGDSSVISNIPIIHGENRLKLVPDTQSVSWDWLGLDLDDAGFLQKGRPSAAFPLAPPDPISGERETITLDPCQGLDLSGFTEIQNDVFGVSTHNGLDALANCPAFQQSVKRLNFSVIKGGDGVMTTAPKTVLSTPQQFDAYYQSDTPRKQYEAWYWNLGNLQVPKLARVLGVKTIAIGSGLPQWSLMPVQKADWNVPPTDPWAAARMVKGMFETVRPFWPELDHIYLWNEPNAGWWRGNGEAKARYGRTWAQYFQDYTHAVSAEVKIAFPQVKIGVPSTYNPPLPEGTRDGGNYANIEWTGLWEPLIRQNWNDVDFWDFHFYGNDPREVLANLEALAAAGEALHHERKPVSITESNYAEPVTESRSLQMEPDGWRYRSLPYARFLVAAAGRPDLLWANMCHDLAAGAYGLYTSGALTPTSLVDVFEALAPLRGQLLGTSSGDPAFTWTASRIGNLLVLAIVTGERNGRPISLQLPPDFFGDATVKHVTLNHTLNNVETQTTSLPLKEGRLDIPPIPGSLIVVSYKIPEGHPVTTYRRQVAHFADQFVQVLDQRKPSLQWGITCARPEAGTRCRLRVATGGYGELKNVSFFWNGTPIALTGRFVSEVSIPLETIMEKNEFRAELKTSHPGFVIASACLVFENDIIPLKNLR